MALKRVTTKEGEVYFVDAKTGERKKTGIETQKNGEPDILWGVAGWLKFFIIVNLYIAPVFFVIQYGLAWYGFTLLANKYPNIYLSGLIDTIVRIILTIMGIQAAISLKNIEKGAVQKVKLYLKLAIGWIILSIPISFMSGLDTDMLIPQIMKEVILGVIGFAIWYSYFTVSVRVKSTYSNFGEEEPQEITVYECSNCKQTVLETDKICNNCGAIL